MSNFVTTPVVVELEGEHLAAMLRNRRLALAREALRMYKRGETMREIGLALGVSHETARTLIREGREAGASE